MPVISLRERKRVETWTGLHEAASSLALASESLAAVTIEDIVARAHVSARTFFNYFNTKEDAILGFREPRISEDELAGFASSTGPLLNRVADFYFDVVRSSRTSGPTKRRRRRALIRRHGELASRQLAHFFQVEELVRTAVREQLANSPLPAGFTIAEHSEILIAASAAAHRVASRLALTKDSAADERAAMHRALDQLREVTRINP